MDFIVKFIYFIKILNRTTKKRFVFFLSNKIYQ